MSSEVHSDGNCSSHSFRCCRGFAAEKNSSVCPPAIVVPRQKLVGRGRIAQQRDDHRGASSFSWLWRSRLSRWPRFSRVPRPLACPLQHAAKKRACVIES
jgi:hypothetical protein